MAIACEEGEIVKPLNAVWRKRYIAKGDYQQTSGARSEKRIPTGKLFGLRKFEKIKTPAGIGFITGYFTIATLEGTTIHPAVNMNACNYSPKR